MIPLKRVMETRGRLLFSVRSFLVSRGYVEVETPVRIAAPALELNINAEKSGDMFLRTSPELHMKRMLCAGLEKIFQLGPCFRSGERGKLHNPEYTMLEWYRTGVGYMEILEETRELVIAVARETTGSSLMGKIDLAGEWQVMTIRDMFMRHAGWDPVEHYDADRFDLDLVGKIEPALKINSAVVLKDYPAEAAALSLCSRRDFGMIAERWELYLGGMEIANAFSELTDPLEQRKRFEECARDRREKGREVYPVDEDFMKAMEKGMPVAGGVALGIDRLLMFLVGASSIDEVRML